MSSYGTDCNIYYGFHWRQVKHEEYCDRCNASSNACRTGAGDKKIIHQFIEPMKKGKPESQESLFLFFTPRTVRASRTVRDIRDIKFLSNF